MSVGNRLREIREKQELTQTKMAQIIDIAQSHLHRYESNQSKLTADKIELLYNFGINTEWLITGNGKMFRDGFEPNEYEEPFDRYGYAVKKGKKISPLISQEDNKERDIKNKPTFSVPMFDIQASAGSGIFNDSNDLILGTFELGEEFRNYWGQDIGLIKVSGDSMEPTIKRNSWVLVKKCNQLMSEGVFIFIRDNELRCKRILKDMSGKIHIISDNKKYPEEIYDQDNNTLVNLTVLAQVICAMNEV